MLAACGSDGAPTMVQFPCVFGGGNRRGPPLSGRRVTAEPAWARG